MKGMDPERAMKHLEGRFALISVAAEALTPQGENFDKGFDLARAISDLANDTANDCLDLAKEYAEQERRLIEERRAEAGGTRQAAQGQVKTQETGS